MKTPEQMAEEYAAGKVAGVHYRDAKTGFLAGYKAAQDQLADVSKVMPDTCEHILDMSKMVDVNGWISVKDRLPEVLESVLILYAPNNEARNDYRMECWNWPENPVYETQFVTHWMPLPTLPEER
jgi:hypothetical protein